MEDYKKKQYIDSIFGFEESQFQNHNNNDQTIFCIRERNQQHFKPSNNEYINKIKLTQNFLQEQDNFHGEPTIKNKVNRSFEQLIEFSNLNSKKRILQDSDKFRHEFWFKIQQFFRQVQQYCDIFYNNVRQTVQNTNQFIFKKKNGFKSDRICLKRNLIQSLKFSCQFYQSQKINTLMANLVSKISSYLQKYALSSLPQLFKIPFIRNQDQYECQQAKQRSYSEHKKIDKKNLAFHKNLKHHQSKKIINKHINNQSDHSYGLSQPSKQQKQQSISNSFIPKISHKNKQQLKFSQFINEQIPFCSSLTLFSKQKLKIINKQRSIDRIMIKPIINPVLDNVQLMIHPQKDESFFESGSLNSCLSRDFFQQNKEINTNNSKSKIHYWLGNNNTSAICQWCQELYINPNINTRTIPIVHKRSISRFANNTNQRLQIINKPYILTSLCLCNEEKDIAVGSTNSFIYIYQTQNSKMETKLVGHSSSVCCLFEQNKILFSGGDIPCCSIILWNTQNWTIRSKVNYHTAAICSIIGIPNTNYIVSSSFDRNIYLYDYSRSLLSSYCKNKDTKLVVFTRLFYYEHLQKLVGVSPSIYLTVFRVSMNTEHFNFFYDKTINCGAKITDAEKSATKSSNLLIVGTQKGNISIYDMDQCVQIKEISINSGFITNMIIFNRNFKCKFPLVLFVSQGCKTLNMINTQTSYFKSYNLKQNIEVMHFQGTGPLMIINSSNQLLWVNQNSDRPSIHIVQFQIF